LARLQGAAILPVLGDKSVTQWWAIPVMKTDKPARTALRHQ